MEKAHAGAVFTPEQLAWSGLNRDHVATRLPKAFRFVGVIGRNTHVMTYCDNNPLELFG
jgi:hypothetical protein